MPGFEFVTVDQKTWDSLPLLTPPKKPDEYDEIIGALEQGHILRIKTESVNDLKGKRIAIGRRSRARGFATEFRNEGDFLFARRSDKPVEQKEPKERRKKEPAGA